MVDGSFEWHEVSDDERAEILENSKHLLEEFGSKLDKIKVEEKHFESGEGLRDEGEPWKTDGGFRDLMLLNAPFVEDDFLVAEKGGWKK